LTYKFTNGARMDTDFQIQIKVDNFEIK